MEEFALIKLRVNLNRINLGIALISDLKVVTGRIAGIMNTCPNHVLSLVGYV